ncbi:MAG: TonB-dependent receptor plug domain-containing protein [Fibrobacteraceae bacterium]
MLFPLRFFSHFALWCAFFWGAPVFAAGEVNFTGVLSDTLFVSAKNISVEVLETGEKKNVQMNTIFSFSLPPDSVWNFCVEGLVDTMKRGKCYSVKKEILGNSFFYKLSGGDSSSVLVSGEREPREKLLSEGDSTASAAPVNADSILAGSSSEKMELKKVVVELRRKPKRKMGESVVSSKSIKRMPGLAEADVIRSVQALPGVVASSDFSTKLYVRGGASDENLFLFDNGVVYSPMHFFGLFSTFLVEGIDGVSFYKGGFPVEYGNRLSSVLDMHSREGGSDTADEWLARSSIKVSTFAAQLHTEGHQGDFRWVLAGRSTYISQMLDLFNYIGLIDFDLDYSFTDLQGALYYTLGEGRSLELSFYSGKDELVFDPIKISWGNTVIPLNFRWRFNSAWSYQGTFAYSRFYQSMGISSLLSMKNDITTFAVKQKLIHRVSNEHTLSYGFDAEYDKVLFGEKFSNNEMEDEPETFHYAPYLMDSWSLTPMMTLLFGVRGNYQTLAKNFDVEPRVTWHYAFDSDKSLELHVGRYLQYLNSVMFTSGESLNEFYYPVNKTSSGKYLSPSSSWLFSAEYKQNNLFANWFENPFSGVIGAYYKTQNNLTTFASGSSDSTNSNESLADYFGTAEGYSFGYELSLRKDEGRVFGGVSFSESWSVLKDDQGIVYFPDWHQPYSVKIDLGVNWKGGDEALFKHKKKGRYLRSSAVLKYASGMPVTDYTGYYVSRDVDSETSSSGNYGADQSLVVVEGGRNQGHQPNYFRLDLKAIDMGREDKWNFSWTIINVTNHTNIFSYSYDTSENPPKLQKTSQFPFLPVMFSYEYYF